MDGIQQTSSLQQDRPRRRINVGQKERKASMAGGVALAISGLQQLSRRRYLPGLAMLSTGAMMFYRGKTGHCNLYQAVGLDTARGTASIIRLEKAITINRSPRQVFDFWHDLENLPRFMQHLAEVKVTGPRRSHWKAVGPGGITVEWDAETVLDIPGQQISWQSVGDSDIPNEGAVRFEEAPENQGTALSVIISYHPPGGVAGKAAAKFLEGLNAQQIEDDLKRLKQILEAEATAPQAMAV